MENSVIPSSFAGHKSLIRTEVYNGADFAFTYKHGTGPATAR